MVMVQNTYGTKWFLVVVRNGKLWYEMVMVQNTYGTKLQFCGTKWLWCKIHMVRNGFWLWYEIAILWYQMVNYGAKWQWYEMVMVRNDLPRLNLCTPS